MENNENNNGSYSAQLCCFRLWMSRQEESLDELLHAIDLGHHGDDDDSERMGRLVDRNLRDFREYAQKRDILAQSSPSPYFTPTWCSSIEGSMLWAGGCRPTSFIRLTYALSGHKTLSNLDERLVGGGGGGGAPRNGGDWLWELSASQMGSINRLHMKTIKEEDELTKKLARPLMGSLGPQQMFCVTPILSG